MITKGFENIQIKEFELTLETLPSNFSGFKIIHIADLHISKRLSVSKIEQFIERLNGIEADIIALTGDLIDAPMSQIKEHLHLFKRVNKPLYFVSGNHELLYAKNSIDQLCSLINATNLDNTKTTLHISDQSITLLGLSDRYSKFFGKKRETKELFHNNAKTTILLAHQPRDIDVASQNNITLQLSGHTHGGQIRPFDLFVRLFQPYIYGLHKIKNTFLYVTCGVGTWGVHYRYKTRAEISLITLK